MKTKLQIVAAHAPDADDDKRTISGLVLPYGVPGYTSSGAVTVASGTVTLPEDLGRIKLLRDHSTDEGFSPVGHATAIEDTPEGLRMSFKVAKTADGDVALADVTERVRDALSVELVHTSIDEDGNLIAGELKAVALVPIPAFDDARVELITASAHYPDTDEEEPDDDFVEGLEDTPVKRPKLPLSAHAVVTPDGTTVRLNETDGATADTENVHPSGDTDNDHPATPEKEPDMNGNAKAPEGIQAAKKDTPLTFSAAVHAIGDLAARRETPELTAALKDITYSGQPATRAPKWVGELWDGAAFTREIVPTMTPKTLTSLEVRGWRWKEKPQVDDWDGDKRAIPSNTASTEPIDSKAKRLAAGWDFDRAYWDFGDTEFIRSFLEAAREDYAIKSDERAAQSIAKWATEESTLTATAQPDLLHAAAHARQLIKKATRIEPTAFLVHPDDMFGLFDITMLDIPQFLKLLGVEPEKFISTDLVPAGSLVSYVKPAVEFHELAGAPIRVSAQHIANGGIDEALFGYWDALLINPRGIVSVPVGAGAAAA